METSVMTTKGQVVVPAKIRKKYGIKPGVKIAFIEKDGDLLIKPMDEAYFQQFIGIFENDEPGLSGFRELKAEELNSEQGKLDKWS